MNKQQLKALTARLSLLREIQTMNHNELTFKEQDILMMNFDDKEDRKTLLEAIDERRKELPDIYDLEAVTSEIKLDFGGVET